ncbi:ATP-binding protein [Inquilinus limosus]|uniref:ATP-binding protein n=1 Tax=Inquilinus limosus TaxID=171674 RepID=UPI00041E770B|nr:ATP-binding protein [Inquilinus limosus]
MNTLRARIILLLAVAIVAVVGIASFVALLLLREPSPSRTVEPFARQIQLIADLVENGIGPADNPGRAADFELHPTRAPGEPDPRGSELLQDAMRATGPALPVQVTHGAQDGRAILSVQIDPKRWLWLPMPDLPIPQGVPLAFAGWMLLLVLGAIGIAAVAADRVVRPLALLEGTIARIGPDGTLPELPETGSAEMKTTARTLNRLSARLGAAMESRMRLVAAAGHDLRTPMTRMRLRAEFLPEEERDAWLRDLDELDRIADSAIRLVREEVEGGDAEPVRLDRLVETVCAELAEQGLPVTLLRTAPASVKAGPLALKRALRNLVINAATHGQGAEVALDAVFDASGGEGEGEARITITDRGPGIPAELLAQVFEPFFRVDPARRQTVPGAGLGLAIAKEIIDRSGGRIEIANRTGGGLTQIVTLPREEA